MPPKATEPTAASAPGNAVRGSAALVVQDRERARELGRRGNAVSRERAARRKAQAAAAVVLATVADRRAELSKAVAELQAAHLDEARKVTALASAIKLLNDMDGFDELVREVERLRAALTNAAAVGADRVYHLTFGAPAGSDAISVRSLPEGSTASDGTQSDGTNPSERDSK